MKLKRILKLLFSNWHAKVLSLSIALLLTLFFNLTRLEQRTINIPLTVSINDVLAPSSRYPSMVKVVLRGERDVIYSIREDEISASLDLSGYKSEGVYRAPIRLQKRGNALVADPLEIHPEPSDIAIGLEKRIAKSVPVTPSFKGFLESGFELANFDILPPEVTISGPAGLVSTTTEISTDTIELSGKKADFTANVRLLKKDSLLAFEGKDSVVFSATVRKSRDIKNFVNLPISVKGLSPGLTLAEILPTGNVRMHIDEEVTKNFKTGDMLSVDLGNFVKPGTYTVDVILSVPEEAVVETFDPQTLTIKLETSAQPAEPAAGL